MGLRRFIYKGSEVQLPQLEAELLKKKIDRRIMYLILKYYEINPDALTALEAQFPDI